MIIEAVTQFPDRIRRSTSYIIQDSAIHTDNVNSNGEIGYGIVTKTDGWTFNANTNSMEKKTKLEIKETKYVLDIQGPLIDFKQKGNKVRFMGKEPINGIEYLKLRVVLNNKDRLIYYFDSSYFIFRTQYQLSGINQQYTVEYTYQLFGGGYFFVQKSKNLERNIEEVYTNYIVNPAIDRSLFLPHNINKKEQYY